MITNQKTIMKRDKEKQEKYTQTKPILNANFSDF